MERYKSNEKLKDKESTLSQLRKFLKKVKDTDNKLYEIYDRMEELEENDETNSQEYSDLIEKAEELEAKQDKFNSIKAQLKKEFLKIGTLVLAGTIAISGIAFGVSHSINTHREDNIRKALATQGSEIVQMYENSPEKFEELLESPNEITDLALDTLKSKLSNHYGVPNDIDNFSTYYYVKDGTESCYISYNGKVLAEYSAILDSDGFTAKVTNNTLPTGVYEAIKNIASAQNESSTHKAYTALNTVLSDKTNEAIDTELPNYLPSEPDYER